MKKNLVLLIVLVVVLTACGNNNSKTEELSSEISALETQVAELISGLATASAQPTATLTATPTEIPTEIPPTPTDTPEPTLTETLAPSPYECSAVKLVTAIYQKSYTKTGKLRVNDAGNLILKVVPKNEVQRYSLGEVVCYNNNAIQADHMRVFFISSGRGYGYYIPVLAITGG